MITSGRSYLWLGGPESVAHFRSLSLLIDQIAINAEDIGVKELRSTLELVWQKPFGATRLLLITNAHQMSEILQNSLLKLLEEPPPYLTVILQAPEAGRFLPTVRSRLHLLNRQEEDHTSLLTEEEFNRLDELVKQTQDRGQLIDLLSKSLSIGRQMILQAPSARLMARVDLIDRMIRRLEANGNFKLTVDYFLLHWQ